MTINVEIYEMNYAVSPGGVDCWEATVRGYGESKTMSDFSTAGEALNYIVDKYPDELINLTVMSLQHYEKVMTNYAD
jgi:hypothetical protein